MNSFLRLVAGTGLVAASLLLLASSARASWSDEELAALRDLRLVEGPAAPDPTNRWSADEAAAALGHRFFFDTRFSSNGSVSCATCHLPDQQFQDGLQLAQGVGTTTRRTMPIAGLDASPWLFWDGRKDSLWSQALGPLESPVEHGGDRVQYVRLVASAYRDDYERVFGKLPDLAGLPAHAGPNGPPAVRDAWEALPPQKRDAVNRVFANVGKAIAAYERKLQPGVSRFDRYVDAVVAGDDDAASTALGEEEEKGLRLFVGKANCTECHNGPQLTNHDFANTGVPPVPGLPADSGRAAGSGDVLADDFNCLGPYSDAKPETCRELRHLQSGHHAVRQYKVPSLRNVAERAPYMHAGQLPTLEAVLDHYDRAPAAPAGHSELRQLGLSFTEKKQLVSFLRTLSAPLATEAKWLAPPLAPGASAPVVAEKRGDGETTVEGSVVVAAPAARLLPVLTGLDEWPKLFRDVRAMKRAGGIWSVDNRAFGHAHPFRAVEAEGGVRLELADEHHGRASLDYRLEPVDEARARLTLRYFMTTPEQLTQEQVVQLLRKKATSDLQDFASNAPRFAARKEQP